MTEFTPWASLTGGMLIGLASVLLMAFRGRIFGATGILTGFMTPNSSSDWSWRAVLLAGIVSSPLFYLAASGGWPEIVTPVSKAMLVVGGLIVGIGVTIGSGCTSGHGVCGVARLSRRSIVATVTFMVVTAVTVYVMRHVIGS